MTFDKRKYIYIAIASLLTAVALYVSYVLIAEGSPTVKSRNEYLISANSLHQDSLYDEAVEPYMKAIAFDAHHSLANYNAATNSLMRNYPQLQKAFNEEGYKLSADVDSAIADLLDKYAVAAEFQSDTAKYSSIYQNIGVTLHMLDSLQLAAEAYKEALRKNPADEDARYNLAVILHQMKNDDQSQQDKQEEQQQKEEKQEEQKQEEQQNKEEQPQQPQQPQQPKQQEQKEAEKDNVEQMLKALMQDEKELREKMDKLQKDKDAKSTIEKNW
ncbi:MAG: hypothetical protein IIV89_06625 [Bacteroidaceae bacterium]|nr:hypothetical protein [Bacteroidaceae bacterium]